LPKPKSSLQPWLHYANKQSGANWKVKIKTNQTKTFSSSALYVEEKQKNTKIKKDGGVITSQNNSPKNGRENQSFPHTRKTVPEANLVELLLPTAL
jgi:hypothetical protein